MKNKAKSTRLPEVEVATRVIKNFVVKARRARYLAMMEKPSAKGGYGFGELAHFTQNLDLKYCKQIPGALQTVEHVFREIRALTNTSERYIIHESPDLDGQWMDLREALDMVLGQNMGAFVVVDNGAIIYHESEDIKHRYIGVRQDF